MFCMILSRRVDPPCLFTIIIPTHFLDAKNKVFLKQLLEQAPLVFLYYPIKLTRSVYASTALARIAEQTTKD